MDAAHGALVGSSRHHLGPSDGVTMQIDDWHRKHFPGLEHEFQAVFKAFGVGDDDSGLYNSCRILMTMLRENIENRGVVKLFVEPPEKHEAGYGPQDYDD
jgi:hypothetical protein